MFRKIPKIASSSKSSVGALSQASRSPNGSWQGIWNAVSCSMLLQGSSQGESTVLEKPKAQALKGTFSPNLRGDLKTETGHAGPAWALSHLTVFKEQGTQGTRAAPSVCHCQYLSCCGLRAPNPSQSSAFSHRWPGYNDNTGIVLYSDLPKCSNTCKTNLGVGKKLHKIKQILIKKGCCPAC